MTTVDREVSQQRSQMTQQNNELKARLEKSIKDGIELRQLLEAAAKSDARNEALLKGMKLAHEEDQRGLLAEREKIKSEKEELEIYRHALKDKEVQNTSRVTEVEYKLKQSETNRKQLQGFLAEKEAECDQLSADLEIVRKKLKTATQ